MRRAALLAALLAACAAPRRDAERPGLVVVSDFERPGRAELGAGNLPTGRDVEVLRRIASRSDHVILWRRTTAERALALLSNGGAAIACFDPGVTAAWNVERVQSSDGSVSFAVTLLDPEVLEWLRSGLATLEESGELDALLE